MSYFAFDFPVRLHGSAHQESYRVHRSPNQLQNKESSPTSLGGIRFQSPPTPLNLTYEGRQSVPSPTRRGLGRGGDLGGTNLRDETQETCVYTVAKRGSREKGFIPLFAEKLNTLFN